MLTVIVGPMFSGKSTELLRRLERARIAGRNVALLRPQTDTRDFLTHGGIQAPNIKAEPVSGLGAVDINAYDVIGVEEGQFIPGLVPHVTAWADAGKDILVTGLLYTSERRPFRPMLELLAEAEEIVHLNAVCMRCGSDQGSFTHYKAGDKTAEIVVGGADLYEALCRRCYNAAMLGKEGTITLTP